MEGFEWNDTSSSFEPLFGHSIYFSKAGIKKTKHLWLFDFCLIIQKWKLKYKAFFFSWSKSDK